MNMGYLTPQHQVYQSKDPITIQKLWKNYYKKNNTFVNLD